MKLRKILMEIKKDAMIELTWYHGTVADFNEFDLKHLGKNFKESTLGVYLTQYKYPPPYGTNAKEYAVNSISDVDDVPMIYTCKLMSDNFFVQDIADWPSAVAYIDRNRSDIIALKSKYDGIIAADFSQSGIDDMDAICVVFNPAHIKIIKKESVDTKTYTNPYK